MDISSTLLENVAILLAEFASGNEPESGKVYPYSGYTRMIERCHYLCESSGFSPVVWIEKDPNRSLHDDVIVQLELAAICAIKKNISGFCDRIKCIEMYLVDEVEMLSSLEKMVTK
jgi:hypothetical protein